MLRRPSLIRRHRLHRHQLSVITQLIHRRTEGWKAIRDGRFLCGTKNELPGDWGWGVLAGFREERGSGGSQKMAMRQQWMNGSKR